MRFFLNLALVLLALHLGTAAAEPQVLPTPEPRKGVPSDRCLIELSLPNDATVRINDRDYGKQRKILLPLPAPPSDPNAWDSPGFHVVVDFSNGGRLSEFVVAKGGTAAQIALSAPSPTITLLKGPQGEITSLAFSPDGKWIAMGTDEEQAILWETSTGLIRWDGEVPSTNAASDSVYVAFSPDGRHLVVGGEASGVVVLDVATGKCLRDLADDAGEELDISDANAVAFTPDGRQILAALYNRPAIAVWNARGGRKARILRESNATPDNTVHEYEYKSIAVSPDGRQVVAGSYEDDYVVVFDLKSGKVVRRFQSNAGGVNSVAISHDGKKLLAGAYNTKAILWDMLTGKKLRTYYCSTDEYVHAVESVAFSPDDRRVLAGAGERTFLFDIDSGIPVRDFKNSDDLTCAVAFSPDGRRVLTAGERNWVSDRETPLYEACLWDIATGKKAQTYPTPKDAVQSLAFDAAGKWLTVNYEGVRSVAWDMGTGKPANGLPQKANKSGPAPDADAGEESPLAHRDGRGPASDEYRSADGRWTIRAGKHNTVLLGDRRTSKEITILSYPMMPVIRAAFNAKGTRIAVADKDSVHIFNPATGKELATFFSLYAGRDWLVTTPDSFCAGSPGGLSLVRVRVGDAEYRIERFQKHLNSPEGVARALQGTP